MEAVAEQEYLKVPYQDFSQLQVLHVPVGAMDGCSTDLAVGHKYSSLAQAVPPPALM